VALAAGTLHAAQDPVKLDGYAEWKRGDDLLVDGQRIHPTTVTRWRGHATSVGTTDLGDEVRVRGHRTSDGTVLASVIDVRANSPNQLFEQDVRAGADRVERSWLRAGRAFDPGRDGRTVGMGEIEQSGPDIDRVDRILRRLVPPYLDGSRLRTYVISSREWNAMAMANGAVWMFRGMLDDMSDDELAVVIGHELAHYTHEHGRRQSRHGVWTQLAGVATALAADVIDSPKQREAVRLGAALTLSAVISGYGRDLEDQADRVGLRYAYEGGFDIAVAPHVWERFEARYGDENRVANFFFSDHSRARDRRKNLLSEIALNYRSEARPTHSRRYP
jgi:hypothetical protein